jgi:hypothetical protein
MTEESGSYEEIEENPLVAKLIAQGAETAMTLRGYVGPSTNEGHLRLYPRLANLQVSVDIPRADILHFVEAPQSRLGAVIVWVKRDAQLAVRRVESSDTGTGKPPADLVDVNKGRLRMRLRAPGGNREVCFSTCMDCLSWCDCSICSSLPE